MNVIDGSSDVQNSVLLFGILSKRQEVRTTTTLNPLASVLTKSSVVSEEAPFNPFTFQCFLLSLPSDYISKHSSSQKKTEGIVNNHSLTILNKENIRIFVCYFTSDLKSIDVKLCTNDFQYWSKHQIKYLEKQDILTMPLLENRSLSKNHPYSKFINILRHNIKISKSIKSIFNIKGNGHSQASFTALGKGTEGGMYVT